MPTKAADDEYTYEFSAWDDGSWNDDETVKTYTPKFTRTAKQDVSYKVVSGAGSSWTKGSTGALAFTFKRSVDDASTFGHFTGVKVDGKAVPEKDSSGNANWTARSGSVVVALQPRYLETLSTGDHVIAASFDDAGDASAKFVVKAKGGSSSSSGKSSSSSSGRTTPATGDSLGGTPLTIALVSVASALAAIAAFFLRRRQAG